MTSRLAWLTLFLTTLWVGLMIAVMAKAGPLRSWQQILAHTAQGGILYSASYLNASLLTLANTWLFILLVRLALTERSLERTLALLALYLYGVLNIFCYISQITLVPWLVVQSADPWRVAWAEHWLRATVQLWPSSQVALLNGLAYALLGLPALWVGRWLWGRSRTASWAGALLALNSLACWVGLLGFLLRSPGLANGVTVGGAFYWLALMPLSWGLMRGSFFDPNLNEE